MPSLVFFNPLNPKQKFYTMLVNDPAIPAGWLNSQGSDGATPEALQIYVAGLASGGYPAYGDLTTNPTWPNGIINGYGGGKPGSGKPGG
jgi:hypothetical protein